jgi:hypothetical protein
LRHELGVEHLDLGDAVADAPAQSFVGFLGAPGYE